MSVAPRLVMVALAAVLAAAALVCGPAPARAAEYTMATDARYAVDPEARQIAVEVAVTFENTTPDPAGQFSVFETIDLAIHAGATEVAARDGEGQLAVSASAGDGFQAVSVRLRNGVRFEQRVSLTLAYTLADGANPDVRIRPSVVIFPAWSFGTSGTVTVALPPNVEVRHAGSDLTPRTDEGGVLLESGEIDDPASWLAMVTASQSLAYVTLDGEVPLASGTIDLRVRAWADDEAWGERTLELLGTALPLLEEEIGLDYPRVGPLVVVESLPEGRGTGLSEPEPGSSELAVAFDEPPFTVLHQAAHIWISEALAGERWIREGFASHAAAAVAGEVDAELPFDPAERADELAEHAFPLVSWGVGDTAAEQDGWAYATSWMLADRLSAAVGSDALRLAWQRIAAGVNPYDPVEGEPAPAAAPVPAADSRRLLDQLEAVSDQDVSELFAATAFDEATRGELADRAAARDAFANLLEAAGEWGAPDPIRSHLAGWRFDEAVSAIDEALAWLEDRDALLLAAQRVGLTPPQRLRDRYLTGGGGPDARQELDAEAAVVSAYQSVLDRAQRQLSFIERVGLLGSPDPADRLTQASASFTEGDLRGAAESVESARAALASAELDGIVRLASAAAVLLALIALAVAVLRRRRATGYTAAP